MRDIDMAEPVIDFITSLDGYASAKGWPGWWGLEGIQLLEYVPTVLSGPPGPAPS